jgi:hypothetical protein
VVVSIHPKDWYPWIIRKNLSAPDFTGILNVDSLSPIAAPDSPLLVISGICSVASSVLNPAIVLYDENATAISVSTASLTAASGFTNAAGNVVAYGGAVAGGAPGYVEADLAAVAGYAVVVQAIFAGTWDLWHKAF